MSMWMKLAWRLFRHEARKGELTVILSAIILSVTAVLSLSLFSEKLQTAMTDRTAEILASDRKLNSRQPIDTQWLAKAEELDLNIAQQIRTDSMAFANDKLQLVQIRAASSEFPLKGEIKVAEEAFVEGEVIDTLPGPSEVWVDSRLFQGLNLAIGSDLELGDAIFTVSKVLIYSPDIGVSFFGGNSNVIIHHDSFAKTNLDGPGARVRYSHFYTGEKGNLETYYDWLRPQLDRELHFWLSAENDQSPLGQSVRTAEHFFLLASLLAIILAAVAIAVSAHRYSQRHYDPVAIMKTLGASQNTVRKIYVAQMSLITVFGIVIGAILGYVIQEVISSLIAKNYGVDLSGWHWRPLIIALFTGCICALLFSLYPLMKLFSVPPLRVLRRDLGANLSSRFLQFLSAGGAIFGLMLLYSQDLVISAILFAVGVFLVVALMLITFVLIKIGRKLGQGKIGPWQLAWARINRRALDNSVQLISFSVTIMLLLIVLVMRNDMVDQWQAQLPNGSANYFLANISHEQKDELESHFAEMQVKTDPLFPVVRARLVGINDESIDTDYTDRFNSDELAEQNEQGDEDDERRRGLGREANLTWSTHLHDGNEIVEGEWFNQYKPGDPYGVSIASDVADGMDLKLGDVLTFNIGSEIVKVTVTSIREVNWMSVQVNFLFVLQPEALSHYIPTYISKFYLEDDRTNELSQLMRPFSSVSLIDFGTFLEQIRTVIEQVSLAVEFILILVLVSGSLVLVAQVQASMDERQQELAILRTLGAKGSLIRQSVIFEFIIIGVVAGMMAAVANELALILLQTQVFQMQPSIHWQYWLTAPLAGAVVVGILGAASCWHLLTFSTSQLLRRMI